MTDATVVNLTGVPETMLWTLHTRASEALREDGMLRDPEAVRIYRSIAYDYERSFGRSDGTHAMRSRIFDAAVRPWMDAHPGATVVELACGLETQFQRIDDGRVHWHCVDLPESIAVRERFLEPSERCRYIGKSVLDLSWMDEVDAQKPVFVTAQGLFMYLEERDVRTLITAMAERFPDLELMFDTMPRWFSRRTLQGFDLTPHYRVPPMPWGIGRSEVEARLRSWSPRVLSVHHLPLGRFRGVPGLLFPLVSRLPLLRDHLSSYVRVRYCPRPG